MINYNRYDSDGMPSEEEFPYDHDPRCDYDNEPCQKCADYQRWMAAVEDYEDEDWDTVRWGDE